MKIEFLERDDELKAVIAVINGQRKILSLSKTVEDILNMPVPSVLEVRVEKAIQGLEEVKQVILDPHTRITQAVVKGHEAMLADLPENRTSEQPSGPAEQEEPEFQREDLVKVVQYIKGLSDAQGSELVPRNGVYAGGIYRIWKVNKTGVTLPDAPDKITWIINNIEVIDDKAPRPELLVLMPGEFVLYKKGKRGQIINGKTSELLPCQACGEKNAFFLNGTKFEGKCRCGYFNSIERMIVPCENEKCVDGAKNRNRVSLFLNGDTFAGQCGECKQGIEQKREAVPA